MHMIRNYLKVAWRNLMKHKIFSIVNIAGLTIGLACSLFILLWVGNEWSYDQHHTRLPQLYSVMENQVYSGNDIFTTSATPGPLAPKLKADIPGIRKATRFSWPMEKVIAAGEKRFREEGYYTDNQTLDMFSFPLLSGNAATALKQPGSIVISRKLAEKYFGTAAATGKTMRIDDKKDYLVTAVMENIPVNSSLQFDYLLPIDELIAQEARLTTAMSEIEAAWQRFNPAFPFSSHFMSEDFDRMYRSEQVIGRLAAAFTILAIIIACLGLFGLSTFTARQRTREIGIRKVLGASVTSIVALLSKEFLLLISVAIVIATPLAGYLMYRWLQNFAYHVSLSWWLFALTGGAALCVALLTVSIQTVKAALVNPVRSLRTE